MWAVYDLLAYIQGGEAVTISRVILDFSEFSPTIIAIFFYLGGHFFWPQNSNKDKQND